MANFTIFWHSLPLHCKFLEVKDHIIHSFWMNFSLLTMSLVNSEALKHARPVQYVFWVTRQAIKKAWRECSGGWGEKGAAGLARVKAREGLVEEVLGCEWCAEAVQMCVACVWGCRHAEELHKRKTKRRVLVKPSSTWKEDVEVEESEFGEQWCKMKPERKARLKNHMRNLLLISRPE